LGSNFVKVLDDEVAKCDTLLAIIDRGWLSARDDDGKRRLDNSHDFVRIEVAAALKRDIPVIPILIDGAQVPNADRAAASFCASRCPLRRNRLPHPSRAPSCQVTGKCSSIHCPG
jgi:hypothetical protein